MVVLCHVTCGVLYFSLVTLPQSVFSAEWKEEEAMRSEYLVSVVWQPLMVLSVECTDAIEAIKCVCILGLLSVV